MRDDSYAWPLGYSLIWLELTKDVRSYGEVEPANVEFQFFASVEAILQHLLLVIVIGSVDGWQDRRLSDAWVLFDLSKSKFLSGFGNDIVNRVVRIDYEPAIRFLLLLLGLYDLLYTPARTISLILTVYFYPVAILIFVIIILIGLVKSCDIQIQSLYFFLLQIFIIDLSRARIFHLYFLFEVRSLQHML